MFIEPIVLKATPKPTEFAVHEEKIENLKTYVYSNVQKFGKGPEAWRSTTRTAKQEIFGPYTQSNNADEVIKEESED